MYVTVAVAVSLLFGTGVTVHTVPTKVPHLNLPGWNLTSVKMLPAGMHDARSCTVLLAVNASVHVPVDPCALFGVTTSRMVIAANPMMSYLSKSPLVLKTEPCGGAPAIGAPGPSQLIGKSRVCPLRPRTELHNCEFGSFPTPLMPPSEHT